MTLHLLLEIHVLLHLLLFHLYCALLRDVGVSAGRAGRILVLFFLTLLIIVFLFSDLAFQLLHRIEVRHRLHLLPSSLLHLLLLQLLLLERREHLVLGILDIRSRRVFSQRTFSLNRFLACFKFRFWASEHSSDILRRRSSNLRKVRLVLLNLVRSVVENRLLLLITLSGLLQINWHTVYLPGLERILRHRSKFRSFSWGLSHKLGVLQVGVRHQEVFSDLNFFSCTELLLLMLLLLSLHVRVGEGVACFGFVELGLRGHWLVW